MTTQLPATQPGSTELKEPNMALEPLYHLILLDDDDHTYAYVVEMLGRLFGYGREKAFALAAIVDNESRAVLETASHTQVTRHQEQIHGYGADASIPHCKGSMSAIVEKANGQTEN